MIVGDNGDIFRIVGSRSAASELHYDNYGDADRRARGAAARLHAGRRRLQPGRQAAHGHRRAPTRSTASPATTSSTARRQRRPLRRRPERQHRRRLRQRLDLRRHRRRRHPRRRRAHLRQPQQHGVSASRSTASPRSRRRRSTRSSTTPSDNQRSRHQRRRRAQVHRRPDAGQPRPEQMPRSTTLIRAPLDAERHHLRRPRQRLAPRRRRRRRDLGRRGADQSYATNYDQTGVLLAGRSASDYAHPFNPGNVLGYDPTHDGTVRAVRRERSAAQDPVRRRPGAR